jgi:hypothetical protein
MPLGARAMYQAGTRALAHTIPAFVDFRQSHLKLYFPAVELCLPPHDNIVS